MYNILPTIQQSIVFVVVGKLLQNYSWDNHHHENASHRPLFHSWGCSRPEIWWAGLVTWIIHPCATVFCSGLRLVFVHEAKATCVASSSCPTIVPHRQFCKLLTVAIINHPTWKKCYNLSRLGFGIPMLSWGWDQATTVLRSIISPGLD